MSNENIIIVDDNDNIIGSKPRDIVDKEKLRYRVSCLWIKNSNDEMLFARRAYIKTHFPGKWGPAVEDFEIQKDEVAEVKWFSRKEFLDCLEKNPNDFIPRMKEYFEIFENNSVAIYTTSV